jgi:hypothetical protein
MALTPSLLHIFSQENRDRPSIQLSTNVWKPTMLSSALASLTLVILATAEPTWPDKYDGLEDMMATNSGYLRFGFSDCEYIS